MSARIHLSAVGAVLAAAVLLAACQPPPVDVVQRGYRGTGMDEVYHPAAIAAAAGINTPPAPSAPASPDGPRASQVFKNVKVLGDLSAGEFAQIMVDMTAWVSPQQGCTYCHNAANFADDSMYAKVVARRMLQMTQHINADWKQHVADTGVTCYTCHRGNNVPNNVWYKSADATSGMLGWKAGQNSPAPQVGLASLPNDPFTPYELGNEDIRVVSTSALPDGSKPSMIKQTEKTYGLMMHMSQSLGVNCTYCHNTRSFASWEMSTPQRATAYYGIRLVRDLNTAYLGSLEGVFPANRLGPTGDVPKLNCATCHQGAYKPLYGANILNGHPGLMKVVAPVTATTSAAGGDGAMLYFDVGSATLPADAAATLAPIVQAAAANATGSVAISGFNSATGSAELNAELAKQRAFAVRDALVAAGVPESRIVLDKPQQTDANVSGEDRSARRVQVSMR